MKHLWILLVVMASSHFGCATSNGGSFPKERPADLVVTYYNGGGMQNRSEHYYISQDSCVRDSRFEGHQNRWICKADPKRLDELYAQFVKDDIASIQTKNEGEVYDRGGITLRLSFGGKNFEIQNAGSNFVVEKDAARFDRAADGIVNLVDQCVQNQAIDVEIVMQVQTGDSVAQRCSLTFDNNTVIDWQTGTKKSLEGPYRVRLLPGRYEIEGSAQVGTKWSSLQWPIKVTPEQRSFQFILKNDSFEIIHD